MSNTPTSWNFASNTASPNWAGFGNQSKGSNPFGTSPTTGAFGTSSTTGTFGTSTTTNAFNAGASTTDIKAGIFLNDTPSDTIADICINNNKIIAAASWSGIKIWKNNPKPAQPTTSTTTNSFTTTTTQPAIKYNFESFDNILESSKLIEKHDEPVTRCTFDTLNNSVIYFGNAYGKINKIYLEGNNKEEYAGHQKDMITGLKYNRYRCMLVSSSCDGLCYLWDPRTKPIGCGEINTGINSTNIDFCRDTVAVCGISMKEPYSPTVSLFDIRNLTNPPLPQPASTFTMTTIAQTDNSPYKTITTYPPVNTNIMSNDNASQDKTKDLLQFTSIVLNLNADNFIAGTLGGFTISSKKQRDSSAISVTDTYAFEEKILFSHKSSKTKTAGNVFAQTQTQPQGENRSCAINCLAMIQTPFQTREIRSNGVFAGLSNGYIVSLSGFRVPTVQKDIPTLNVIKQNYMQIKQPGEPVTACGVSPNGRYLVYATGDDYSQTFKITTEETDKIPVKTVIKGIDSANDFEKSNLL